MQAVEQAREQSGCHQAPSLSHPGGEGRRWWAGLAIFILLLGCGLHETMQTEESSGLGQAQGWDWHGAGQVLTGSWQSVLKTQALQQAPNPNGRRSFPRLPCFPAPVLVDCPVLPQAVGWIAYSTGSGSPPQHPLPSKFQSCSLGAKTKAQGDPQCQRQPVAFLSMEAGHVAKGF